MAFLNPCVRQGDPLSPSLFVVAMELSKSSKNAINSGAFLPYHTRRNDLKISHLLYADDVLIFSNGSWQSIDHLKGILSQFCKLSSQRLNEDKSFIFFPNHCSADDKECVLKISKFSDGSLPITYLGAPLFSGRIRNYYFDDLVAKIRIRIEGWMKNFLTMPGPSSFDSICFKSLTIHIMSALAIPNEILHRIEWLFANFLWDHANTKRDHWVSFAMICRPHEYGGLNIRPLKKVLEGLHGKLAWIYLQWKVC